MAARLGVCVCSVECGSDLIDAGDRVPGVLGLVDPDFSSEAAAALPHPFTNVCRCMSLSVTVLCFPYSNEIRT